MKNLKRFAKIILTTALTLIVVNLVVLLYAYMTSVRTMKDTLANIATVVAEENCIALSKRGDPKSAQQQSIESLLVEHSNVWLTYNSGKSNGRGTLREDELLYSGNKPTNITQVPKATAVNNISWSKKSVDANTFSAIKLSTDGTNTNNPELYSYTTCPQRGTPITINLNAEVKGKFVTFFGFIDYAIPIHESTTVVGMKYYRGR